MLRVHCQKVQLHGKPGPGASEHAGLHAHLCHKIPVTCVTEMSLSDFQMFRYVFSYCCSVVHRSHCLTHTGGDLASRALTSLGQIAASVRFAGISIPSMFKKKF